MEDSNTFIKWTALAFIAFIFSLSSCSISKASKATEMVINGADPLAVSCLLYGTDRDPVCVILASKK